MSIQFRFVLPAVAGLVLLGLITYLLASSIHAREVETEVIRRNEVVLAGLDRETDLAARHALELAGVMSALPPAIQALERAHQGDLDDPLDPTIQAAREWLREQTKRYRQRFADVTGSSPLRVHYHLPNARSFLRVWRERQVQRDGAWVDLSDDLTGFRRTVVEMHRTGRPVRGIELGRGGFTIRGVVPVRDEQGRTLGSVEALAPFDHVLARHLEGTGQRHALLMDEAGLKVTTGIENPDALARVDAGDHRYVVLDVSPSTDLEALVPRDLLRGARDRTVHHFSEPFMVSLHPVRDFAGKQVGLVVLATDHASLLAEQAAFRGYLALSTLGSVLAVGLALFWLSRRVRQRITTTNDRLRDLAEGPGDLDSRLHVSGRDEMAELARHFNALMDRLQSSFEGVARNMRKVLQVVPPTRSDDSGVQRARTLSEATAQTDEIVDRVTAAIEAWQRAEQSRALLAAIVESSDDAIYGMDLEGRILSWNQGAERAYGLGAQEAIGQHVSLLSPSDDPDQLEMTLGAIQRGEAQRHCEVTRVSKRGLRFPVSVALSPLRGAYGELVGAAVIERDITQRRRAEEEAEQQRQQLVQADKLASLGTLVAGVAHEISNPNSFIMLNAPVIRDIWTELVPHLDAYRSEHGDFNVGAMPFEACRDWVPTLLTDIESGAERIKGIVTSLKDYARQDPPTMRDEVDVNKVVQSAVALTRSRLDKATRHFSLDVAPELPAVRGSFQRVEQVVVNLILNACDALSGPESAVRITTRENDGEVEIVVRDEGSGMDERTLARIRDPFFTTKRNSGGTGLGVSISDGIVHEHGGSLRFVSEPGRGTTVTVALPAIRGQE